jgi:hypothetical protein
MRCKEIEDLFENLGEHDYDQKDVSPQDINYNCIAWAAGENHRRWWPTKRLGGYWWPPQLPQDEETKENFICAFELLGYRVCKNSNRKEGLEKIAMYLDPQGIPTHMARQIDSGGFIWWSKCGDFEDIKHKTLFALEGEKFKNGESGYGNAIVFLHRRRDGKPFLKDRIISVLKKIFRD